MAVVVDLNRYRRLRLRRLVLVGERCVMCENDGVAAMAVAPDPLDIFCPTCHGTTLVAVPDDDDRPAA